MRYCHGLPKVAIWQTVLKYQFVFYVKESWGFDQEDQVSRRAQEDTSLCLDDKSLARVLIDQVSSELILI